MKSKSVVFACLLVTSCFFYNCTSTPGTSAGTGSGSSATNTKYNGFASQVEWGKHIVVVSGCGDCHTPKKMTAHGPVPDESRMLAGSPSPALLPDIPAASIAKGAAGTVDETAWTGPWGKSFASNITSDSTGIGNWTEEQFIYCLRKGAAKGLANTRPLMPPMPWQSISQMTDDEIKAMFAYLKSTTPVHNVVPAYEPPMAMK